MARPNKIGLDYFPLDCVFDDDKIALIESDFGLKGFAIIVKLWQKIYASNGYYCDWSPKVAKLFKSNNQIGGSQLLEEVLQSAFEYDIFSKEMHDKHGILTSKGVQKRYLAAASDSRRKRIDFRSEYLLIDVPNNLVNVYINGVCVCINPVNEDDNPQKEREKEREKEKEKERESERTGEAPHALFYGSFKNVELTAEEYNHIINDYTEGLKLIDHTSRYLANTNKSFRNHYALILKIADEDKWEKNQAEQKARVEDYKRRLNEAFEKGEI